MENIHHRHSTWVGGYCFCFSPNAGIVLMKLSGPCEQLAVMLTLQGHIPCVVPEE
jgi:hypothetical protein